MHLPLVPSAILVVPPALRTLVFSRAVILDPAAHYNHPGSLKTIDAQASPLEILTQLLRGEISTPVFAHAPAGVSTALSGPLVSQAEEHCFLDWRPAHRTPESHLTSVPQLDQIMPKLFQEGLSLTLFLEVSESSDCFRDSSTSRDAKVFF